VPAVSHIARAQAYPSRPVRIIFGLASGSAGDILARLIGQWLSERLGQPFVIENRVGAGGTVAAEAVVRSPPDGYTLLACGSPDVINATLNDKLKFVFLRDIAPVAGIARGPHVLVVNPAFPAKTIPEFIAHAKAGIGTMAHMAPELFKVMAEIDMVHVPYRGVAPALTDLIGGQVQAVFSTTPPAIEHIRAGKLRALAVTSAARSEALPELPTIGHFLPGYEATFMVGLGGPKNVPAEIVDRLNREVNTALAEPGIRARLADLGTVPLPMTSTDFGKLLAEETEKWGKVIRAANIKPQ
jgi:tripartite-type tricarboxylate transporter receptor subunit TctC